MAALLDWIISIATTIPKGETKDNFYVPLLYSYAR